jgi:hypothetical protein
VQGGSGEEGGGEISSTGGDMAYAWVTLAHWWAATVRCSSSCRHSSQPHLTTISIIAIAVAKPSLALQGGAHPRAASAWLSIGRCAGLAAGAAVGSAGAQVRLQQQVHRRGFREEGGGEISSTGGVMAYAWVTPDHWWAAAVRCSSSCRHSRWPHLTAISIIAVAVAKPSLALQGGAHLRAASAWLSIGRCAGLATGAAVGSAGAQVRLQH